MEIDFSGKTAIVTGGTRGIGRSIVEHLVNEHCSVIYTGTAKKPQKPIKNAQYEQLDLSNDHSINQFIQKTINTTKNIDILINNAGINIIEPINTLQQEHWDKILKVNLTGAMQLTQAVSQKMISNKQGKILNISSIFGVTSKEKRGAYSASKFGLIGLTKASALDLAPNNIQVNALSPGFTSTELTTSILSTEEIKTLTSQIPLQRFAHVDEIARVAVFLCSDLNSYITGQTIIVDGGVTTQ